MAGPGDDDFKSKLGLNSALDNFNLKEKEKMLASLSAKQSFVPSAQNPSSESSYPYEWQYDMNTMRRNTGLSAQATPFLPTDEGMYDNVPQQRRPQVHPSVQQQLQHGGYNTSYNQQYSQYPQQPQPQQQPQQYMQQYSNEQYRNQGYESHYPSYAPRTHPQQQEAQGGWTQQYSSHSYTQPTTATPSVPSSGYNPQYTGYGYQQDGVQSYQPPATTQPAVPTTTSPYQQNNPTNRQKAWEAQNYAANNQQQQQRRPTGGVGGSGGQQAAMTWQDPAVAMVGSVGQMQWEGNQSNQQPQTGNWQVGQQQAPAVRKESGPVWPSDPAVIASRLGRKSDTAPLPTGIPIARFSENKLPEATTGVQRDWTRGDQQNSQQPYERNNGDNWTNRGRGNNFMGGRGDRGGRFGGGGRWGGRDQNKDTRGYSGFEQAGGEGGNYDADYHRNQTTSHRGLWPNDGRGRGRLGGGGNKWEEALQQTTSPAAFQHPAQARGGFAGRGPLNTFGRGGDRGGGGVFARYNGREGGRGDFGRGRGRRGGRDDFGKERSSWGGSWAGGQERDDRPPIIPLDAEPIDPSDPSPLATVISRSTAMTNANAASAAEAAAAAELEIERAAISATPPAAQPAAYTLSGDLQGNDDESWADEETDSGWHAKSDEQEEELAKKSSILQQFGLPEEHSAEADGNANGADVDHEESDLATREPNHTHENETLPHTGSNHDENETENEPTEDDNAELPADHAAKEDQNENPVISQGVLLELLNDA